MTFIFRFLLVAAFLLPVSSGSLAQTPAYFTGAEIAKACSNYPDSPRPRNCEAFASSVVDIVTAKDPLSNPRGQLCIGKDVPVPKIVRDINTWLAKHPKARSKSGYDVAQDALSGKYRCK